MNGSPPRKQGSISIWWIAVILLLPMGYFLSTFIPQPVIGIIYLSGTIYDMTAKEINQQIIYARQNPEVRGVVLVIDSPGGTVSGTEAIYMELARLRQTKPVVSTIESISASGAFYIAAGSDWIYAKPSSVIGNIGVIGIMPSHPAIKEEIYSTGPYKLWGNSGDASMRELEMIKQGFLQAVHLGRGDKLKISDEIIARGQVWLGSEALRNGLIDEIGPLSAALDRATSMAQVNHPNYLNLRSLGGFSAPLPPADFFEQAEKAAYPKEAGLYFLYIPQSEGQP